MTRDFHGQQDFWLDHFYQPIGGRRPSSYGPLSTLLDTVPIPSPMNVPLPLVGPCLVWRWGITHDGYGQLGGEYAHQVAYLRTRGDRARVDWPILRHLCNRPFCVQPSHLLPGTDADNKADMAAARRDFYLYKNPAEHEYHFWKAANSDSYAWEPPRPPAMQMPLTGIPALECPHTFLREDGVCANCGIGKAIGHWHDCRKNAHAAYLWPCRCQEIICHCQSCEGGRIMEEQRALGLIPMPYDLS